MKICVFCSSSEYKHKKICLKFYVEPFAMISHHQKRETLATPKDVKEMPAIPRSFVASCAGSYPSALCGWLCRVTLHGDFTDETTSWDDHRIGRHLRRGRMCLKSKQPPGDSK